jgi:hypothetical protein
MHAITNQLNNNSHHTAHTTHSWPIQIGKKKLFVLGLWTAVTKYVQALSKKGNTGPLSLVCQVLFSITRDYTEALPQGTQLSSLKPLSFCGWALY